MNTNTMLSKGPMDVERWTEGFMAGAKRWKGVEQQRLGLGDVLRCNGKAFCELNYTMREIRMRVKLPKTHQQRAIAMNMAKGIRDPHEWRTWKRNVKQLAEPGMMKSLSFNLLQSVPAKIPAGYSECSCYSPIGKSKRLNERTDFKNTKIISR